MKRCASPTEEEKLSMKVAHVPTQIPVGESVVTTIQSFLQVSRESQRRGWNGILSGWQQWRAVVAHRAWRARISAKWQFARFQRGFPESDYARLHLSRLWRREAQGPGQSGLRCGRQFFRRDARFREGSARAQSDGNAAALPGLRPDPWRADELQLRSWQQKNDGPWPVAGRGPAHSQTHAPRAALVAQPRPSAWLAPRSAFYRGA